MRKLKFAVICLIETHINLINSNCARYPLLQTRAGLNEKNYSID